MKQTAQTKSHLNLGLSLIELMVALSLGLLVSLAIGTLFTQTRSSYSQNESIGYIQDNGRYALKALANDLEMVDFWGGFDDPSQIAVWGNAVANSCETTTSDTYLPNQAMEYHRQNSAAGSRFPCASGDFKTTPVVSDFLMVKRVQGQPVETGQVDGQVYFKTDLANVRVVYLRGVNLGPNSNPGVDWEYKYHLYYVDQANQLIRQTLVPGTVITTPEMRRDVIVEGIEYFHIVYGLDIDRNGSIDQYTSTPTISQTPYAYSAQIYVLARSKQPIQGYTNAKSYQLGDISYPNMTDGTVAMNDGFYRRVYSTSVVLRNSYIVSRLSRW